MSIQQKITEDLKSAMKEGSADKVGALRYAISLIKNREIEKKGKSPDSLTDEEVIGVLGKEIKKRKEAIELFRNGGREDLVLEEEKKLAFLSVYVPASMSRAEIESVVEGIIAGGISDFNSVIKEAMKSLKGKADGREVQEVIKAKLE